MKYKTNEQHAEVMKLHSNGMRIVDIVSLTGLTRSCVNNWINRGSKIHGNTAQLKYSRLDPENPIDSLRIKTSSDDVDKMYSAYSFVLGMYLGDGCISKVGRTKSLQIALDMKYNKLNEYVVDQLTVLFGKKPYVLDRSVDRGQKNKSNSLDVKVYSIDMGILFPHEGSGAKHLRKIELTEWQKRIINPIQLVKGLMMSDGSYFHCNTYNRDNYSFCNASKDICRILIEMLDILGIKYNSHTKKKIGVKGTVLKTHVNVNRREEVKKLHDLIGDKNQIV